MKHPVTLTITSLLSILLSHSLGGAVARGLERETISAWRSAHPVV